VSRFAVRSPPIFPARDRQLSENPAASRFLTRFAKGSRNAASLPPSSSSSSCGELRAQEFHGNPLNAISNCVYARHSPRTCRRSTFRSALRARGDPPPLPRGAIELNPLSFFPPTAAAAAAVPPPFPHSRRAGVPLEIKVARCIRASPPPPSPPRLLAREHKRSGISTCTTRGSGCRERTSLDVITPN